MCHTTVDPISSCEHLLGLKLYRIFEALYTCIALTGNAGSFIFRKLVMHEGYLDDFNVFVTSLAVADLLSGLYLAVIGAADFALQGVYQYYDVSWKSGTLCNAAGFVFLLSRQASIFSLAFSVAMVSLRIVCPATAPYSHLLAKLACAAAWILGICVAAVPHLPRMSGVKVVEHTGICIPLPFARPNDDNTFTNHVPAILTMNSVLSVLIVCSQMTIGWSVLREKRNVRTTSSATRWNGLIQAGRLSTVIVTDMVCWFSTGVTAVLSASGLTIPNMISVAVAIFILSSVCALNPFLFMHSVLSERRKERQQADLSKRPENKLKPALKKTQACSCAQEAASQGMGNIALEAASQGLGNIALEGAQHGTDITALEAALQDVGITGQQAVQHGEG
jgi:hypothetical protein